jgi:hypothetical protein
MQLTSCRAATAGIALAGTASAEVVVTSKCTFRARCCFQFSPFFVGDEDEDVNEEVNDAQGHEEEQFVG